jgi:1-phosphofructokinase
LANLGGDVWVLICGSMPTGVDAGTLVRTLVDGAHGRGARVAVDSSGSGLASGLAAGADLLAPNAGELAAISRLPSSSIEGGVFPAAAALAAAHGTELLVSLGADGALWTDGQAGVHARGPAVTPVNTAGAGDALLAGWFSRPGAPPGERLTRAVLWGAAACLSPTTVPDSLPPAESGSEATNVVQLRRWSPALESPS